MASEELDFLDKNGKPNTRAGYSGHNEFLALPMRF
jgi:hypothetical protein